MSTVTARIFVLLPLLASHGSGDGLAAFMHGEKRHAEFGDLAGRAAHGLLNIEKFQVEENILAL